MAQLHNTNFKRTYMEQILDIVRLLSLRVSKVG